MIDLSVKYLGFKLKNPLVASSSPLSISIDNIKKMEEAGISAVVLHSLFEEQLILENKELDTRLVEGTESFPEAITYHPKLKDYNFGHKEYLDYIRRIKKEVSIPIIASFNGVSRTGWVKYAKEIEDAGADALELNIYFLPTDRKVSSSNLEKNYFGLLKDVKSFMKIPLAVKISPFFTSIPYVAGKLKNAGAEGIVLFNRFYQPDFNLENLEVSPKITLSDSTELLLRLRWTAILYSKIKTDLAISGGVHTCEDVIKAIMAGASVSMMTSALLKNGIPYISSILNDITSWLKNHDYKSIKQIKGIMSHKSVSDPQALERANYLEVISSYAWQGSGGKL